MDFDSSKSNEIIINECEPLKVLVLLFDKGHYKRSELDKMSNVEKYKVALLDKAKCVIYNVDEYVDMINSFKPMERYVWTYIITLPMEVYENFWD